MITSFHGEHRWLSNFWSVTIIINNYYTAPSVEHAYQASKADSVVDFLAILKCDTPGDAKRLAKKVPLRKNWEQIKDDTMRNFLWQKFQYPDLMEKLMDTEKHDLIEGNTWGDKYWGAVFENNKWVGENKLGKMLMDIRKELLYGEIRR